METIITIGAALVAIAGAMLLIWGVPALVSHAQQAYRRKVWETALYIARERPDLVGDVAEEFNLQPSTSTDLVRVEPRRRRLVSIETISRSELEKYAHTLEGVAADLRERWLAEMHRADEASNKFSKAEKNRQRWLKKVRKIDAAYREGSDIFPVLHPALARASV